MLSPELRGLAEVERKKGGLEVALRAIQNDLLTLGSSVDAVILDFEASKTD